MAKIDKIMHANLACLGLCLFLLESKSILLTSSSPSIRTFGRCLFFTWSNCILLANLVKASFSSHVMVPTNVDVSEGVHEGEGKRCDFLNCSPWILSAALQELASCGATKPRPCENLRCSFVRAASPALLKNPAF